MALTPYMSLDLPVPTVTIGPDWAEQLNAAIEFVDAHDHTVGKGQLITSAAININDDLPINTYNLENARSYNMQNLGAVISGPSDVRSIYAVLGELYYNDGLGNQIQLTAGGALNASTIGGIGGDYSSSTANVYYSSISKTFFFDQNTNQRAKIDVGDVIIRETVAAANGVTIKSPTSLASGYTLRLPNALPAGNRVLQINSSGDLDPVLVSDTLLDTDAVTNTKILNGAVTLSKMAANSVDSSIFTTATKQAWVKETFSSQNLGLWNALTNTPALADGVGTTGDNYRVSVAGTQNLGSGNITFAVYEYVQYNGTIWEKKTKETFTWTKPAHVNWVIVRGCGGGGGAGSALGDFYKTSGYLFTHTGGGAGNGAVVVPRLVHIPTAVTEVDVELGSGGLPGNITNGFGTLIAPINGVCGNNANPPPGGGGNGENSAFGDFIICPGGLGGDSLADRNPRTPSIISIDDVTPSGPTVIASDYPGGRANEDGFDSAYFAGGTRGTPNNGNAGGGGGASEFAVGGNGGGNPGGSCIPGTDGTLGSGGGGGGGNTNNSYAAATSGFGGTGVVEVWYLWS